MLDDVQRAIEFLRSIPRIPLWMGLAAAVPPKWPVEYTYFAITLILRYGFDIWWPWGIAMATLLGFVGLFAGKEN